MIRRVTLTATLLLLPLSGVANPSLECSVSTTSQVETGQCLADVAERVDVALGIVMDIARETAAELDGITERDVALPALEDSQTAWEAYRTAHCDFAGALFGGGSGTGIAIQSCRITLTRDRIKALEAKLR